MYVITNDKHIFKKHLRCYVSLSSAQIIANFVLFALSPVTWQSVHLLNHLRMDSAPWTTVRGAISGIGWDGNLQVGWGMEHPVRVEDLVRRNWYIGICSWIIWDHWPFVANEVQLRSAWVTRKFFCDVNTCLNTKSLSCGCLLPWVYCTCQNHTVRIGKNYRKKEKLLSQRQCQAGGPNVGCRPDIIIKDFSTAARHRSDYNCIDKDRTAPILTFLKTWEMGCFSSKKLLLIWGWVLWTLDFFKMF